MIQNAAFMGNGKLLKGALHCHTTRSDGRGTPEEVIKLHVDSGYQFMAITDHRLYNYRNYAPDQKITIIPGMEMDGNIIGDEGVHCFHSVVIGPPREDGNGFEQDQTIASARVKDQFEYQNTLDMLHQSGNMTTLCHPEWSNTPAREFEKLQGNFAMEIWNSGCAIECEMDTNAAYWDELLMQGIKIHGIAVDDGHGMHQHCKGWVMVNAENDVNAILSALKDGKFYSSCGPEIYDYHIEDGVATVECSPVESIAFRYGLCPTIIERGGGELITHARFEVPEYFKYLRVIAKDGEGRRAWTNPIHLK